MTRALPAADAVRAAMDTVLTEAAATGRRATIAAVERHLGLAHTTFYRHYQDLAVEYFRPRAVTTSPPDRPARADGAESDQEQLRRLRQDNTELRRTVELYAEAIRQLAWENQTLRERGVITILPTRTAR